MLNQLMAYTYSYRSSTVSGTEADGLIAGLLAAFAAMFLIILAIYIIAIIGMWKMFEKAGREGWKSLIPFYNMYVLTEISGQNGWMFLVCFIPCVGPLV